MQQPPGPPYRPSGSGGPPPRPMPPGAGGFPPGSRPPGPPAGYPHAQAGHPGASGVPNAYPGYPGGPPPGAPAPGWHPNPAGPAATGPLGMERLAVPGRPRKSRGALRFVAGTCVFSAWVTLVLAIFGGFGAFIGAAAIPGSMPTRPAFSGLEGAPQPGSQPGLGGMPGLGGAGSLGEGLMGGGGAGGALGQLGGLGAEAGGMGPGGMGSLMAFLPGILKGFYIASGLFTLVSGAVTFVLFLGLGQACYALLDVEEQAHQNHELLQTVLARLGAGRA